MKELAVTSSAQADQSPDLLAERWAHALAQYELWTSIWADNPALAANAGERVRQLMMPLYEVQRLHADDLK